MSSLEDLTKIRMGALVVRGQDFVSWVASEGKDDIPTYIVTSEPKICMGILCVDILGEKSMQDVPVGKLMPTGL
jgi:uncharacterized membrane protein (DUF441 family)